MGKLGDEAPGVDQEMFDNAIFVVNLVWFTDTAKSPHPEYRLYHGKSPLSLPPSEDAHVLTARKALRVLVKAGCDEQLLLAGVVLIACPHRLWDEWRAVFEPPDPDRLERDLKEVSKTVRRANTALTNADILHGVEDPLEGYFYKHYNRLWRTIEEYAERIPPVLRAIKKSRRANFERNQALRMVADHIESLTGKRYWKELASLAAAFGSDVDVDALKQLYHDSKRFSAE